MAGKPPRDTLLAALDAFDAAGFVDAASPPLAVDLGCGEGRDTVELLRRGWRVVAIDGHTEGLKRTRDREDLPPVAAKHLDLRHEAFEECSIPSCDLLNASFSLPFCRPNAFGALWTVIRAAIEPGGRFAGHFFGDRDSWATIADRSHHTREEVEDLLAGMKVEMLQEEERDGEDASGRGKHWHVFHVVARKEAD